MHDDKLLELLRNSRAMSDFKQAVLKFANSEDSFLIQYSRGTPRIKIIRVLMQLLESCADEEISDVQIAGVSTCSAFRGTVAFGPAEKKFTFEWDCRWKAEEAGFVTWYGAPDQSKAAEVFGYQCFRQFRPSDESS